MISIKINKRKINEKKLSENFAVKHGKQFLFFAKTTKKKRKKIQRKKKTKFYDRW